jgi:hypothetical protein
MERRFHFEISRTAIYTPGPEEIRAFNSQLVTETDSTKLKASGYDKTRFPAFFVPSFYSGPIEIIKMIVPAH